MVLIAIEFKTRNKRNEREKKTKSNRIKGVIVGIYIKPVSAALQIGRNRTEGKGL